MWLGHRESRNRQNAAVQLRLAAVAARAVARHAPARQSRHAYRRAGPFIAQAVLRLKIFGPSGKKKNHALAESGSRVIGVAAAFPRMMQFGSSTSRAWLLGDFCIAAEYRSMGPALTLQRACLNDLGKTGDLGWYDFPSSTMAALYSRLHFQRSEQLIRMAKLLRVER